MYVLLIAAAAALGFGLIIQGMQRQRMRRIVAGAAVLAGTASFFALMSFWAEMLWFESVGYSGRFWTVVLAMTGTLAAGAAAGGLGVLILTLPIPKQIAASRRWPEILGAAVGGAWGLLSWDVVLRYLHGVHTGVREPALGRDAGFYLFTLPFLDRLYWLLSGVTAISVAAAAVAALSIHSRSGAITTLRGVLRPHPIDGAPPADGGAEPAGGSAEPAGGSAEPAGDGAEPAPRARPATASEAAARPLLFTLGALGLVLAWGKYIDVFHLLYSRLGVVFGPGWTDMHVRRPAYYVVAVILALAGTSFIVAAASRRLSLRLGASWPRLRASIVAPAGFIGAVWIAGLLVLPLLFQWLRVVPNEITLEKPYLVNNIEFTRRGFHLDKVEERPFAPSGELSQEVIAANEHLLSEVRLWDPGALEAVFEQFQEIRLYYEMSNIDIDRYRMDGQYRQVMVAPREMEVENLPPQNRTFVNERIKYTHGYGLAMASVRDFTPDGLPNLLVKDIPPRAEHPELRVNRPEIYYGERTEGYVVASTEEKEFDYPQGERNVYTRYAGTGGVQMSSFWRRLVLGWKLGGTRLLFSGYPTDESRVMFHRNVRERVATLAPFLDYDEDPYLVVVDGRLSWIIDAYTTSRYYPYSTPYFSRENIETSAGGDVNVRSSVADYLHGANYVRNAVKAVVDAYDGSVTFYVFEPEDPIIRAWSRIFPDLFKSRAEMPAGLLAHVRYPEGFLLAQGLVYAKYHMTHPEVFYNQEDLWIRATERYYDELRAVEPYYVMWQLPGEAKAEFSIIQPFTPKNRQVLIGWVAGLCDPDNYGRLIAYRFPKDQWVLGTQQVDTKIDQDRYLAAQLTLWDQRGSRVIRGNVLVIPIGETLLYVEPIYLQAEAAAYPELRVVVLMHGDKMSYADTFDEALRGLVTGAPAGAAGAGLPADARAQELARQANEAFESYLNLLGEKRFEEGAVQLGKLSRAIQELAGSAPGAPQAEPPDPARVK